MYYLKFLQLLINSLPYKFNRIRMLQNGHVVRLEHFMHCDLLASVVADPVGAHRCRLLVHSSIAISHELRGWVVGEVSEIGNKDGKPTASTYPGAHSNLSGVGTPVP